MSDEKEKGKTVACEQKFKEKEEEEENDEENEEKKEKEEEIEKEEEKEKEEGRTMVTLSSTERGTGEISNCIR